MATCAPDEASESQIAVPQASRGFWSRSAVAFGVFVVLAVGHTWPLATNPSHLSRNDAADAELNTWAIAWVAHQLPRDPVHLFDANIFYPERYTLAYSEAMIVQGVLAMPALALGGSPVLAYNLVLLAGFALTGWAFWLLVRQWTGSAAAAYVSGSLAAFNAHVLVRLPHLQTQHAEFIALALFALDAAVVLRRTRDGVWLGVAFALQALASVYLMVFTTWLLLFAGAARLRELLRRERRRTVTVIAIAIATALVILAPYLAAYAAVHRLQGFERSIDDARRWAGSWTDYLTTGSRLYFPLFGKEYFFRSTAAGFPGFAAIVLVLLAAAWPESRRDPRVRMCAVAGIGCAAVAIAPRTAIFPVLYRIVPLFRMVRVNAHLVQLVLLMIAVVAGYGVAGLLRRCGRRGAAVLGLAALALVNVEALRAPLAYEPFARIPAVYDALLRERHAVIVELPLYPPALAFGNAGYMLASTKHWRPMLNGYSGFRPSSYDRTYERIEGFPDAASLIALKERGVTHVIIHRDQMAPERLAPIAQIASLEPVAADGPIVIYRLR